MPVDRIKDLGATVLAVPGQDDVPALVARIVRLWAELHEFDADLALELARRLPTTRIERATASPGLSK
jgi:hypothetical protein